MLRVLSGPQAGAQLALRDGVQLVGSNEAACDIVLFGDDIAAAHCRLAVAGAGELRVQVLEGAEVQLNGQALTAGDHGIEVPAHLRIASLDLLVYASQPQGDAGFSDSILEEPGAVPAVPARRKAMRWIAALVCVAGITVCTRGALGWFDSAEPHEIASARHVVAQLGYRDLAVAYDVEGLLTVTGYVRSPQDAERIRHAFHDFPGKAVIVRVVVIGAASQLERVPARRPEETRRLGAGSVLIEPQAALPAASHEASAESAVDLQVRALRAGDDGYVETTTGARYFIGSQMPGGYTLKAVADNAITLTRDEVDVEVPVRR